MKEIDFVLKGLDSFKHRTRVMHNSISDSHICFLINKNQNKQSCQNIINEYSLLWLHKKYVLAYNVSVFVDMSGLIPEEEDEDQEMYDDVGPMVDNDTAEPEAIDEDIYEELPGLNQNHILLL